MLTCDFIPTFCAFLQNLMQTYTIKHTYHPFSACHQQRDNINSQWNGPKIELLSNQGGLEPKGCLKTDW
jgi:hypothetical protein